MARFTIAAAHLLAALAGSPLLTASCGNAPPTPRTELARPPIAAADGLVIGANNNGRSVDQQLDENVQVVVRADGAEPVVVELAPGWYLEQNGLRFEPGDRILAEGTPRSGQDVLVASKVRKGNTTVLLRNASGEPLWSTPDGGAPR